MLRINQINNVYNTPNINFKAGVQTNHGVEVPSPKSNMVEGGLLTGFVGTVIPLFSKVHERADKIEKGLEETKLNVMA